MKISKVKTEKVSGLCPRCAARIKETFDGYCLNCRLTWDLKNSKSFKGYKVERVLEYLDDAKERAETAKMVPMEWRKLLDWDEVKANYHLTF